MRGMLNTSTTPSPEQRSVARPDGSVTTMVNALVPHELRTALTIFSSIASLLLSLQLAGRSGFPNLDTLDTPGATTRPDPVLSGTSLINDKAA
jgi:hypothetical protein